jgi:hypothetical protein
MIGMKTIKVAAADLGVAEAMLLNEHKRGQLPMMIIGKQRFVSESDLETWLNSKRVTKPVKKKLSPEHLAKIRESAAARKALR